LSPSILDNSSQQSLIQEKAGNKTHTNNMLCYISQGLKFGQAKRQSQAGIIELNQELGECEYFSEQCSSSNLGRTALKNKCKIVY